MAISRVMKIDEIKYNTEEYDRPTTAAAYQPTTIMKYMGHRTVGLNHPTTFQGSLRNFVLTTMGSTLKAPPISTNHGLASLVHSSSYSTLSPIQIIDGERIIDEHRELAKINETLTESILQCYNFDVHNRAQELQLQWLDNNANVNTSTIDKMFRTEIQTGQQLIEDTLRNKPDLEKKLNDIHQTTLANDEHYQQLLSKRNSANREVFEYHRYLAQTRAETEFLRYRVQYFNDEIHFYIFKNESLYNRQVKLRYELDEDIFGKQVLQLELEALENEKITNEDLRLTAMDDVRGAVDITQIATLQPSNYYREQLTHHVRRIRAEYETKSQTYREELHRKFELEFHRYQMYKARPVPNITREHEEKLNQYQYERKTTEQQIRSVQTSISEIQNQVEIIEKQILDSNIDIGETSKSQRDLAMLQQIIREREKQLDHASGIRTELKQRIERYRHEINEYSKQIATGSHELKQSLVSTPPKSILRSSSSTTHELSAEKHQQEQLPSSDSIPFNSLSFRPKQQTIIEANEPVPNEGTLVRFGDVMVEQDCKELNRILTQDCIDEIAIIRILCNRSIAERLQIRGTYKQLFTHNLINVIDDVIIDNLKNILKILLLSPIERACYELQRILKDRDTDKNILIEIFLTHSNKQMQTIINYYTKLFNNTLEQDIIGDKETPSKRIYLALLQANRPEGEEIDGDEVTDDARNLYETNSKWKIDGSTFIQLLCNRSNTHLRQTFAVYQQFSGIDIEQSIKTDTDPNLSRTLMAIVRIIRNRARFYAYEIRKSLKGSNTNEDNLTRIIVCRCEVDMMQIKSEYEEITKRTLFDHIQTDTKGNYKRALLELLRQRIEPINKESPFKQLLEPPELPKKTRPSVQWKEPLNTQSYEINTNNRNFQKTKPFDCDNQAKRGTLLTMNT